MTQIFSKITHSISFQYFLAADVLDLMISKNPGHYEEKCSILAKRSYPMPHWLMLSDHINILLFIGRCQVAI